MPDPKYFLYPSIFSIFLILTACGGGDSDSGSNLDTSGTQLSEDAFIQSLTSGIIRFDSDVDLKTFSSSFEYNGVTYTNTLSGSTKGSQVISVIINGSSITTDNCTLADPETRNLSDTALSDDDLSLVGCTTSYFKVSDSLYRINNDCDGSLTPSFSTELIYISSNPAFNLGSASLDFNSGTYSNSTANSGVCGSVTQSNNTRTTTPEGAIPDSITNETQILITTPYVNNDKLELDITFSGENPTAGEYTITDFITFASNNAAVLSLRSTAFGGTTDFPNELQALSGNVNLTETSSLSYTGNFDVMLDNGDNVTGSFSLNLN